MVGALWLTVVAVLTAPQPWSALGVGLDASWQAALDVAFRRQLQWGSRIVWTYGPYGYMNTLQFMDFDTWMPGMVATVVAHAAFFAVLGLFLRQVGARLWQWLFLGAIMLLPLYRNIVSQTEFELLTAVVVLLHLAASSQNSTVARLLAAAAGVTTGFELLLKGTSLIASAVLVAVFVLLSLERGRLDRVLALLGSTLVSFIGLWLLAGQSVLAIPAYNRSSYEIAAGYAAGVSVTVVARPELQVGIAVAMFALTGLTALAALLRGNRTLFSVLLLSMPLMFVMFKEGIVRFGEARLLTFWSVLAVLQGLVLVRALCSTSGRWRPILALPPAATVLASALLIGGLGNAIGETTYPYTPWATVTLPSRAAAYLHAAELVRSPTRRAHEEAEVMQKLRDFYRLPPELVADLRQGDVDVVPWDQALVFAYGLDWNPRPVLQSYSAYRPYLDHLDAEHFRSANAPRFVLLYVKDVDGRYPLFSEPETYRVIFERYVVRERTPMFLLLERHADATSSRTSTIAEVSAPLGAWIEVPPHGDGPIYGRVDVGYTGPGQALDLFYKPPELHVRLRFAANRVSPAYRFIPAVATKGLPLSSYALDPESVEHLIDGRFDQPIEAFRVVADQPAWAYEQRMRVTYFTTSTGQRPT